MGVYMEGEVGQGSVEGLGEGRAKEVFMERGGEGTWGLGMGGLVEELARDGSAGGWGVGG